jgi:hypothetical protein
MTNPDLTLKHFFAYDGEDLPRVWLSEAESGAALSHLREKVLREAHGIQWPAAFSEILKRVENLLDPDIPGIMATAWNKYRLLRKYLDRDKYPPDKTVMVSLAAHTVKSEHRPAIEIMINDQLVGKVDFLVTVSLAFEGLTLKIRGGRILEIQTGSCIGKGAISCENCMLVERETAPFPLPGVVKLGDGVPIAP